MLSLQLIGPSNITVWCCPYLISNSKLANCELDCEINLVSGVEKKSAKPTFGCIIFVNPWYCCGFIWQLSSFLIFSQIHSHHLRRRRNSLLFSQMILMETRQCQCSLALAALQPTLDHFRFLHALFWQPLDNGDWPLGFENYKSQNYHHICDD